MRKFLLVLPLLEAARPAIDRDKETALAEMSFDFQDSMSTWGTATTTYLPGLQGNEVPGVLHRLHIGPQYMPELFDERMDQDLRASIILGQGSWLAVPTTTFNYDAVHVRSGRVFFVGLAAMAEWPTSVVKASISAMREAKPVSFVLAASNGLLLRQMLWELTQKLLPDVDEERQNVMRCNLHSSRKGRTFMLLTLGVGFHTATDGQLIAGAQAAGASQLALAMLDALRDRGSCQALYEVVEDDERCYEYDCTFKKTPAAMTVEDTLAALVPMPNFNAAPKPNNLQREPRRCGAASCEAALSPEELKTLPWDRLGLTRVQVKDNGLEPTAHDLGGVKVFAIPGRTEHKPKAAILLSSADEAAALEDLAKLSQDLAGLLMQNVHLLTPAGLVLAGTELKLYQITNLVEGMKAHLIKSHHAEVAEGLINCSLELEEKEDADNHRAMALISLGVPWDVVTVGKVDVLDQAKDNCALALTVAAMNEVRRSRSCAVLEEIAEIARKTQCKLVDTIGKDADIPNIEPWPSTAILPLPPLGWFDAPVLSDAGLSPPRSASAKVDGLEGDATSGDEVFGHPRAGLAPEPGLRRLGPIKPT
ncbi:unnamed protein product [Effrenium voratum]|uniref:Uncharacterized protein n=1 Tax=Effrenium voratum TaxID=2562239 RepID=A0AA36IM36_9DINO|nr:unnamed protein product [Effrenium voratum]